jgi:hypothetical protein
MTFFTLTPVRAALMLALGAMPPMATSPMALASRPKAWAVPALPLPTMRLPG